MICRSIIGLSGIFSSFFISQGPEDSAKKVQALSEKERGAFDVLMELKKSPVAPPAVPATNDQEKDAAMALLQVL